MTASSLATTATYIGADLIALAVLVGAFYLPRHGRKDLTAAFVSVNVGVLAVTLLLSTATVSTGLGLGLFGVLSIIRLRSAEISQGEIGYFFACLALGLLGGIQTASLATVVLLMALVVLALGIMDSPVLLTRHRHEIIMLDRAFPDESELVAHLESLLHAQVRRVEVQRLDLVNDTTLVDVRYRLPPQPARDTPHTTAHTSARAVPSAPTTLPTSAATSPVYAAPAPLTGAARAWEAVR